jgi:protein tyrosine/serine phosphatase
MPNPLKQSLLSFQDRLTEAIGTDISTPGARRAAWWHYQLMDHAFLRIWWKNLGQIGPGVWRSNQPSTADLERLAKMGLKTVLNLRGPATQSFYLFEAEACARLGLTLIDLGMSARRAPPRETLQQLIGIFDTAEAPLLVHCKSGADRTGLAAAIWRMTKAGETAAAAARELSLRFIHLKRTSTGVQDQLLRSYAAEGEALGKSFRDWLAEDYDPARIEAQFAAWRKGKTF